MVNLLNHIASKYMFVINRVSNVVDSGVWHSAALEDVEPVLCCAELQFGFNHCVEDLAVLDAQGVGGEAGVCDPFGLGEFAAEDGVEFVVAATDCDVGVFGFVGAVRDYGCCKDLSELFLHTAVM
jgi:hypothetical protein